MYLSPKCIKARQSKDLIGILTSKPSLKIGTTNVICWNSLGLFRDYGLNHIFFRNKTFLCFKIEGWNFQHLFENFNSITQLIEKTEITNSLKKLNELKLVLKQILKVSAFYLETQKSFIPKKNVFKPFSISN